MRLHLKWCILLDNTIHICIKRQIYIQLCTEKTHKDQWICENQVSDTGPLGLLFLVVFFLIQLDVTEKKHVPTCDFNMIDL